MRWLPRAVDFARDYGLSREDVESVIHDGDSRITLDPTSASLGYRVLRYRRGDVTVVVGYRDETKPSILYIIVGDAAPAAPARSTGGGRGHSDAPRSWRELQSRCVSAGLRLKPGVRVGSINDSGDPHALKNAWKQIERQSRRKV